MRCSHKNGFARIVVQYGIFISLLLTRFAASQEASQSIDPVVVAKVNDAKIARSLVEFELRNSIGNLKLNKEQTATAKRAVVEKLINQLVVLEFLAGHSLSAGKNQIAEKVDELKAQLSKIDRPLKEHLEEAKITLTDLEFQFKWQIAWGNYLKQKLDDDFLESHFERNRRQFDGTEIRVAHIFFKAPTPENQTKLKRTVNDLYSQLATNKIAWKLAVKNHSQAPTSDASGVIGWIKLNGQMPKQFEHATFKLKLNEISEPVQTAFGIHIIKCLDIKQGKIGWRDNLEAVQSDAGRFLFDSIVSTHRDKTTITRSPNH